MAVSNWSVCVCMCVCVVWQGDRWQVWWMSSSRWCVSE